MTFKDETTFRLWCQKQRFSDTTIAVIQRIRQSPPSRLTSGGRGNVHARVPSQKMGVTIQSESRTAEKPGMRIFYEYDEMLEDNADAPVIEYYDQPEKVPLKYRSASGRQVTAWHTPDFFVIREDGAAWEEWKTEEELARLAQKQPARYQKDEHGNWRCPPGEAYASTLSLQYRLRSNAEIDWNLFSNLEFLHDYLSEPCSVLHPTAYDALITHIQQEPGISLASLLHLEVAQPDHIYSLIASRQLYVDLCAARLVSPDQVRVYTCRAAATAHQHLLRQQQPVTGWQSIRMQSGTPIQWDGQPWQVVNDGATHVTLRHQQTEVMQNVRRDDVVSALASGIMVSHLVDEGKENNIHEVVHDAWRHATEHDYAIANARLQVLKLLEHGQTLISIWVNDDIRSVLGSQKTRRTIRTWRKRFAEAEQQCGKGYIGLLPQIYKRGNRERKLSEAALEKMQDFIETRYEDLRQPFVAAVWAEYCQACEAEGVVPASLRTFGGTVKQRPRDVQRHKREGHRAAHQVQKRYWYLDATTPKHGERAWHIVHIDHTRLDIQLRHSQTGKSVGRPWATFAVDAYARRLLGVVLTLDDQPSYRNCMLVLREMVRRFHRLPQILYVDNGAEFHSTYFQALLAQYAVEVAYRPTAQPRFGDVVERLFRTAHTQFIYNLTGNTQISKQVRLQTKTNDPRELAIWQLDWLYEALQEWSYEIYDQADHATLHQSPRAAFEASLRQHGERNFKWIDYTAFILNALPTPRRGTHRKVHASGVKIDNIWYWHDRMYQSNIMGTQVPVRYDPFNAGLAYAYLDSEWVRCTSEYFTILNNRTELELRIAREELQASFRQHGREVRTVNAKQLADFLVRTTTSESLLRQQQRDQALRDVQMCLPTETDIAPHQHPTTPSDHQARWDHLTLPEDF
jgi:putative transposase